jgi:acetyl esterase/lipase
MSKNQPANYPVTLQANTGEIQRKQLDIAYASLSPAQKLDIYWPAEGSGPFAVILYIHGGAFLGGDKRDIQLNPILAGLERGYAVVSINYRLSGEAIFPALVHDVKAAIRWVRANAKTYQFDPQKIAAWGGSAGGYQALMAGVTAGMVELEDLTLGNPQQAADVQAVVDWFGPTDFLKMDEQLTASGLRPEPGGEHSGPDSPESRLLGRQITLAPELVHAANPETYIRPGAPPFFIQHGTRDGTVPYQQSANMAEKLARVLGKEKVELSLLDGAGHGGPAFQTQENIRKVFNFLERHLK